MENLDVKSKFQLFNTVEQVKDFKDVTNFNDLGERLVIDSELPLNLKSSNSTHSNLEIVFESDEKYTLNIESNGGVWLFIADANYPGWKATIDGKETDVFSAQILGKAIYISPGEHEVIVYFESISFKIGTQLTLFGLLLLIFFLYRWRNNR